MPDRQRLAEKRKAIAAKYTEQLMGLPPLSQHEEECRTEALMILKCLAQGSFEEYAAFKRKLNRF